MSNATTQPYAPYPAPPQPSGTSSKSFIATWILALLLGGLGVDRFYLGKVGTGILKLVTLGGFGIWALIDLIITLAGAQRDKQGHPLAGADNPTNRKVAWVVSAAVIVLGIVLSSVSHPSSSDASAGTAPTASHSVKTDASAPAPSTASTPNTTPSTAPSAAPAPASPAPKAAAPKPAAPAPNVAAPKQAAPPAPTTTVSQDQALLAAKNYLSMGQGFSRAGLIQQLSSQYGNGFSQADATWAADNAGADWNAQAAIAAKNYVSSGMGFSHDSLLQQLTSSYGSGFTEQQAGYGVQQAGL